MDRSGWNKTFRKAFLSLIKHQILVIQKLPFNSSSRWLICLQTNRIGAQSGADVSGYEGIGLGNIGYCWKVAGDFEKAKDFFEQAIAAGADQFEAPLAEVLSQMEHSSS